MNAAADILPGRVYAPRDTVLDPGELKRVQAIFAQHPYLSLIITGLEEDSCSSCDDDDPSWLKGGGQ